MVNWVNNRVTGKSFKDSIHDKLWSKLGTDGETYVLLDKSATLFAGGGLNATPNDLARFGMMMINDGKSTSGEQIVPISVIKTLLKGGDRKAYNNGPDVAIEGWSYRAQWWVRHIPGKESFSAIGVHGQWIYIDVKHNVAIIKQSSQPVSDDPYYDGYNINAFDAIITHLANLK